MNYEEIKRELAKVNVSLQSKKSEKVSYEREIDNLRNKLDNIATDMLSEINRVKAKDLEKAEEEYTSKVTKEINKINEKKDKLKNIYDKNYREINFENFSEYYQDDLDLIMEAKESSEELETVTKSILGERLTDVITSRLDNAEVDIDLEDMESMLSKLQKYEKDLSLLNRKGKFNYSEIFNTLLIKLNPCKDETKENAVQNDVVLYIGICAAISYLTVTMFAPYLVFGLAAVGSVNLYKTSLVYKLLLNTKVLTNNIDKIHKIIKDEVDSEMKEAQDSLDEVYNKKLGRLNKKLSALEEEKMEHIMELHDSYNFDDTMIRQKYDLNKSNIIEERRKVDCKISELDIDINKINKSILELEETLKRLSDGLAEYHLATDRHGTSYMMLEKFLIDVKNKEPVWWEFPYKSSLIVYNGESDMYGLCKLISIQLLNTLHPCAFSLDIWDIKNMGMDLQCFNSLPMNIFNICDESKKVDESLKSLSELNKKRAPTIRKEHNDIREYNQYMLDLESAPESYNILFVTSVDTKIFSKEEFKRLVLKGPELGIYPIVFLTTTELENMGDDGKTLLDNVGSCYELSNGSINNKSKRFYERFFQE